jgi:serine/threonine protein kinase
VEWRVLSVRPGLTLDVTKRIEFALDIARGMACLHAQRPIIIHRDLKTANLLVSARFEIKVADFGLSRIKDASHVSRALRMFFSRVRWPTSIDLALGGVSWHVLVGCLFSVLVVAAALCLVTALHINTACS